MRKIPRTAKLDKAIVRYLLSAMVAKVFKFLPCGLLTEKPDGDWH